MPEAEALSSCDTADMQPMYLEKLWSMTRDHSLRKEERSALEAEYYAQYTKWRSFNSRLMIAIANLGGSPFWDSMCGALCDHGFCGHGHGGSLAKVEEVVCLCLGNLEETATVYQLSLLILLLERLGVRHEKCFVFDPCHSPQEADVLKHLGFTILRENAEARIRVRRMTLFYMPHGDYNLTDNLVGANYDSLHLIAILGNNLSWVCNSEGKDTAAAEEANLATSRAPYVQKVLALVKETHLQDTLASEVRSLLTSLAPRISEAVGTGLCDALDSTLSTFPPKMPWEDVKRPSEPSHLQSAL